MNVANLISGSSAFSKTNLYIWKFLVHIQQKSSLKDFQHKLANMWIEHNWMVVWTFFGIALLWDCPSLGLEWKLSFSIPVATAKFFKFAGIFEVQHFNHIIFQDIK